MFLICFIATARAQTVLNMDSVKAKQVLISQGGILRNSRYEMIFGMSERVRLMAYKFSKSAFERDGRIFEELYFSEENKCDNRLNNIFSKEIDPMI